MNCIFKLSSHDQSRQTIIFNRITNPLTISKLLLKALHLTIFLKVFNLHTCEHFSKNQNFPSGFLNSCTTTSRTKRRHYNLGH